MSVIRRLSSARCSMLIFSILLFVGCGAFGRAGCSIGRALVELEELAAVDNAIDYELSTATIGRTAIELEETHGWSNVVGRGFSTARSETTIRTEYEILQTIERDFPAEFMHARSLNEYEFASDMLRNFKTTLRDF